MKIHESSQPTISSKCDIFAAPNTDASVINGRYVEIPPVNESREGIINFKLGPQEIGYADLSKTYLEIEAKVVKLDGSNIADDEKVILADGGMHSLFETVSLTIDDRDVSLSTDYATSAFLETLLSHDEASKKTHMAASGWAADSACGRNRGDTKIKEVDWKKRATMIQGSKTFQLSDRLHIPLFNQSRLLPSVRLGVKFKRAPASLSLMRMGDNADGTYKILITKATMLLRICELQPAISRAHQKALQANRTYKFPMQQVKTQNSTIPAGVRSFRNVIQVSGNSPDKIFFVLVANAAKDGDYDLNPFRFVHANVSAISLTANGEPVGPILECDFVNNRYNRAYRNLAAATDTLFNSNSNGITLESFADGQAVFSFNLIPTLEDSDGVTLISLRSLEINLNFSVATDKTYSLVVYMEKPELLEIDQNHSVRMVNNVI